MDVIKESKRKIISNYAQLKRYIKAHRILGKKIVCTIGSWDLLHIGHVRYLMKAKSFGDILVVGADSDEAIKRYKGPQRPVLPEQERMEMLSYQSCVDYITLTKDVNKSGKWSMRLLKEIQPDVFVAITESYPGSQLRNIQRLVKELRILPRQASTTSSSNIFQETIKRHVCFIKDAPKNKQKEKSRS